VGQAPVPSLDAQVVESRRGSARRVAGFLFFSLFCVSAFLGSFVFFSLPVSVSHHKKAQKYQKKKKKKEQNHTKKNHKSDKKYQERSCLFECLGLDSYCMLYLFSRSFESSCLPSLSRLSCFALFCFFHRRGNAPPFNIFFFQIRFQI
jgi:hypothetical protein